MIDFYPGGRKQQVREIVFQGHEGGVGTERDRVLNNISEPDEASWVADLATCGDGAAAQVPFRPSELRCEN